MADREISSKSWWIGGTVIALVMALFIYIVFGGPVTPSGSPTWMVSGFIFIGIESMLFTFWLAARNAGRKGIPIR